jgi:predicted RNA polymerase sigma factor
MRAPATAAGAACERALALARDEADRHFLTGRIASL